MLAFFLSVMKDFEFRSGSYQSGSMLKVVWGWLKSKDRSRDHYEFIIVIKAKDCDRFDQNDSNLGIRNAMALLEMSLKDSDKKMSISDKRQDIKLYYIITHWKYFISVYK